MSTYRIKIEKIEGYKHIKNITIDTDNINEIIENIFLTVSSEHTKAKERFLAKLENNVSFTNTIKLMDSDLIDLKSKGDDITTEEFIQNEFLNLD